MWSFSYPDTYSIVITGFLLFMLNSETLLTYLQFSVIKWAKQCPGQNPIDVKSDEAIQI
jgi:hypothetical protein